MTEKTVKVLEIEPFDVDVKVAARLVSLSPSTLNDMRVKGDGPAFVYFRGSVRYPMDGLREWAQNRPRFRSITEADVYGQVSGA